jgi:aminopeptidase N
LVQVILNAQQTGYYRVNYDAANWMMIQWQLNNDHSQIATENRAQLLDDAFNLARAGLLDYTTALSLTTYLGQETEYIPWRSTMNAFFYIDRMLERSSGYGYFRVSAVLSPWTIDVKRKKKKNIIDELRDDIGVI